MRSPDLPLPLGLPVGRGPLAGLTPRAVLGDALPTFEDTGSGVAWAGVPLASPTGAAEGASAPSLSDGVGAAGEGAAVTACGLVCAAAAGSAGGAFECPVA